MLRLPHRGKGATLRDGLLAAGGARRFLCDADLSMPPAQIARFLAVLPSQCDIAIGSREGAGAARIGEPLHRHLLGRVFNTLVRAMVLPGIQDTQCGFKLFTAEAVQAVLPTTAIEGWSFDVELLASARAQGWRIREVPIEWHYGQASRLRVLPHSFEMLRDLFRIRAKVRRGAFARPAERCQAGTARLAADTNRRRPRSSNAPMRLLPVLLLAAITLGAQAPRPRLTPDNVGGLVEAWTLRHARVDRAGAPARKKPAFEATPVYVDGRLYLSTPGGLVIALDAETGAEAWRVDLAVDRGLNYGDFANRGVVVAGDRIYAGTADARLACLMRADGRPCDGFGVGGQIPLDQGLRRPPKWKGEWTLTSPPVVYRDLVIVGSSIADNSRLDMTSGEVRAFDAKTGALRWTFHPLPADSPAGAANTWSRLTVDEANGLVYLPVGSASPDYFGGNRPGDNAHANSVVALKAATGEVAWAFQTVHHDVWDYDVASQPLLFPGVAGPRSPSDRRPGICSSSIGSPARRTSRSSSARCRRATCPRSAPRPRSRSRRSRPASSRSASPRPTSGA